MVQPVEGERWVVTLVGYAGDHPPTDEAGFEEFARRLIGPQVWEAISGAEPLTGIGGYRRTENHWRHYERLKRWPPGSDRAGRLGLRVQPGLRPRHDGERTLG